MIPSLSRLITLAPRATITALGVAAVLFVPAPGATAQNHPAAISGVVRDASGAPQIGALVELLAPNLSAVAHTFTDEHGRYTLPAVMPGTYEVKASDALLLPTLRENLRLLANSHLVVNLTLNTLYQAFQWLPAQPRPADEPRDDWNWTLRLSTNRPLLRVLDDGSSPSTMVVVSEAPDANGPGSSHLTIRSGSNRFGEGGLHQGVEVVRDHDDARQLILRADVGEVDSSTLRSTAAYLRQLGPGTAVISVASFSDRPEVSSGTDRGLQTGSLRSAAVLAPFPGVSLQVGSEFQAVSLGDTLSTDHPFANLAVHHGAWTVSYRMATSPDLQDADNLDRESTLTPRVSESNGQLRLEAGRHQALDVESSAGRQTVGLTLFHDAVTNPVVEGAVAVRGGGPQLAAADAASGDVLYDPATDLIAVTGGSYAGDGVLAFVREQLGPNSWLSLRYAMGQALAMHEAEQAGESLSAGLASLHAQHASMLSAEVGGTIHRSGTDLRASYRWQPSSTLTAVNPFDAATPPPFLGVHLRQPIHNKRLQAILDMRNLLAQGYRPFFSDDGSVLYFAQAERCVEAGLSFTF